MSIDTLLTTIYNIAPVVLFLSMPFSLLLITLMLKHQFEDDFKEKPKGDDK